MSRDSDAPARPDEGLASGRSDQNGSSLLGGCCAGLVFLPFPKKSVGREVLDRVDCVKVERNHSYELNFT